MLRGLTLAAFTVVFAGCAKKDDGDERFGEYLKLMESSDHHLTALEHEKSEERAKNRLGTIRANITRARDTRPAKFGKGIDLYFKDFLNTMTEVESVPWSAESYDKVLDACTRCHEQYRKDE